MSDFIVLDRGTFLRSDDWTREQQDLRETGVVPWQDDNGDWHIKRIVTAYPSERAAFWASVDERASRPMRRLRVVNER